jgi:prepilin-type N-terminal cleavage/methylation domain-containing protein
MKYKSRLGFTLVELLVVIAIIAVLLAVLMPGLRVAKSLSQRIVCKHRLGSIGKALTLYADSYDGLLPPYASDSPGAGYSFPTIRTPYEVRIDTDSNPATANDRWLNLGCLIGAQLLSGGKSLYCPANVAGMEEYQDYTLQPDPAAIDDKSKAKTVPWGTTYNWVCRHSSTSWWHVSTMQGYAFWPQAKKLVKAGELALIPYEGSGTTIGARHAVGYPHTPAKLADANPNKSIACDYAAHSVKGSGYNMQAVFADTHVTMQKVPVGDGKVYPADVGKYWYPYQGNIPEGEDSTKWFEVNTAIYYFAFQP